MGGYTTACQPARIAEETGSKPQERLTTRRDQELTLGQFARLYLEEYYKVYNARPDFKEQALTSLVRILGHVKLQSVQRSHAYQFISLRSQEVSPATINRGLAVLKNMLSYAVERKYLGSNPLSHLPQLPEKPKVRRVLTWEEERRLIASIAEPTIAAYTAILGETGLRMREALHLTWEHIHIQQRFLTVEKAKNGRTRHVPLSDFALEWFHSLIRVSGCPYVFVRLDTGERWRDPRGPFGKGKRKAGLDWVGFHDLRHFRATQWVMRGVDIRTVQQLLGHSTITMTLRYVHCVPSPGSVLEAQNGEKQEWEKLATNRMGANEERNGRRERT